MRSKTGEARQEKQGGRGKTGEARREKQDGRSKTGEARRERQGGRGKAGEARREKQDRRRPPLLPLTSYAFHLASCVFPLPSCIFGRAQGHRPYTHRSPLNWLSPVVPKIPFCVFVLLNWLSPVVPRSWLKFPCIFGRARGPRSYTLAFELAVASCTPLVAKIPSSS